MGFDFDKCRQILHRGLVDALTANADRIRSAALAETPGINGLSYDILPWHRFVCLSFRTWSDCYVKTGDGFQLDVRYSPADWKYYEFIGDGALDVAREYTAEVYALPGGAAAREALHLILLAAADALLDEQVAAILQGLGIDATLHKDGIPRGGFEYLVLDEDKVFRANYCEFILSNRITRRLLGTVP